MFLSIFKNWEFQNFFRDLLTFRGSAPLDMSLNFQCKWCHFSGDFTLQGNPHKLLFSKKIATETILHKFVLQIYYVLSPIFRTIFLQSLFWWEFKENCLLNNYYVTVDWYFLLKWTVTKKYALIIQISVLSGRRTAKCKLWIFGSVRSKNSLY